ncbi:MULTISPECIES: STAS domain-containing protein [Streptomyces]|uniref:Anti-sigma factor antagonist n=1 Tax=Streptomyces venezuelae TaxID=54571 RepID=A0A5P2BLH5_STRVZ|nr:MULTISPECIES: STAS domain-containing protein [Streptomyces]NEA03503.1 STAS domain-containing protein [Streptomyces sp. SID10116]MYY80476.1 anti-sigma factor antagonist [Streptomyces sp. SID335]MYZ12300.1 anti-sigma factor antagonist [Streptomyces sp. SID337]NDZ85075.1 STAS domain-containing protein [Streptomyces sp. SID10115]NEB43103.1 STAS domain-containing protein [Streptomyces sp. SID339]
MSPLKIITGDSATGPVLEIIGDLDHHTAPELRDKLPTVGLRPGGRLVLDLTAMHFCDSSGITALLAARHHAQAAGADIALAAVPANTLRILRIVGLDQIFALHDDVAAATRP